MNWNQTKLCHPCIATFICFGTCMLVESWLTAGGAAAAATLRPGTIVVGVGNVPQDVPNFDTRLIAVDSNTGTTSVVSNNAVGTGPSLTYGTSGSYISYLSQQSDGSLLAVDDALSNDLGPTGRSFESRLYRVDPSTGDPLTGNRTIVADGTHGTGPPVRPELCASGRANARAVHTHPRRAGWIGAAGAAAAVIACVPYGFLLRGRKFVLVHK